MKEIQPKKGEKKKIKKLYSKPVLLLLAIVIVFLAKGTWGVYQKELESRKNVAIVTTELEDLQKRKAELQGETDKINTEEGKEEAIRTKFQVSKGGERVLVVVDRPLPTSFTEENSNFFSKVWDSVSGIFKKDE